MKKISLLSITLVLLLFIRCNNIKNGSPNMFVEEKTKALDGASSQYYESGLDENIPADENISSEEIPIEKAKIIKTANITIKVDNYSKSIIEIKNKIKNFKAKIINENENSYYYGISNNLQISVKNILFDSLVSVLTKDKNVLSKEISAQDVTEEFIDVKARIKSKELVRDKYSDLLKQAKSINDILKISEKLRVIQEEIEAKQGRLAYLKNKTNYSTINLTVKQEDSNIYEPSFSSKIAKGFKSGWDGLKVFFLILIYLWPLWLILTAVFLWIRHYLKKGKLRKNKNNL